MISTVRVYYLLSLSQEAQKSEVGAISSSFLRFQFFYIIFWCLIFGRQNSTTMLPEDKNNTQMAQPGQQQVVEMSVLADFNSAAIMEEMEKVQLEVKSVIDGAIVDSSKLSVNFTV